MSIRLSICLNPWVLDAKGKINNAQIWITKPKALKLKAAKLRLRQEAGATSQSWKVGFTLLLLLYSWIPVQLRMVLSSSFLRELQAYSA